MFFENDEELDYEEGDETVDSEISKVSNENMDLSDRDDSYLEINMDKNETFKIAKAVDNTGKEDAERGKKEGGGGGEREEVKEKISKNKKKFKKDIYNDKKSKFCKRWPRRHSNMFRSSGFGSKVFSSRLNKGNIMSEPLKHINHQPFSNCFNRNLLNNQMGLLLRQNINEQQLLSSMWSRPNLLHQSNLINFQENLLKLEALFPSAPFPEVQYANRFPPIQPQPGILYEQPPTSASVNNNYTTDLNLLFKNVKKKNPFDQEEADVLSTTSGLFSKKGGIDLSQPSQHSLNGAYPQMEESEKFIINIKKQARLQRFMNEDGVKNTSNDILNVSQKTADTNHGNIPLNNTKTLLVESDSHIGKTLNRGIFSLDSNNVNHLRKTIENSQMAIPTLTKKILNKKKNPFETGESNLAGIKKEKTDEYQSELSLAKANMASLSKTGILGVATNQESMLNCSDRSNFSCNNENGTKVTFVRTISKSFDELGLSKSRFENSTVTQKNTSSLQSELTTSLLEESILTGCIVKVFNISKTTTTNDILELCNPVGRVMEIKLNVPKENSAVIRFAKPGDAEDFYALYHGQKYCDNFLNVIII